MAGGAQAQQAAYNTWMGMGVGSGAFKTKAEVGGGGSMDVTGAIKDGASQVLLDGYCKSGGPLTKK
ncbi:MAG: hypothetical protein JSR90_10020 [Proteobacteria bacterium]|nr:hypothetical protein [Pseudomonadota bacterium]